MIVVPHFLLTGESAVADMQPFAAICRLKAELRFITAERDDYFGGRTARRRNDEQEIFTALAGGGKLNTRTGANTLRLMGSSSAKT